MKINGNAVRPGNVILHKDKLWVAVKTQHTQPGKGGAYLQVELKGLKDGTKLNERFRASESVERVRLDEKPFQFLFKEDDMLTLMDQESFDQISVPQDIMGEGADFLQDGCTVTVCFYEDEIVSVSPPERVTLEVVEADAVVKGQTAAASYKPAVLENGIRVMVPPHVEMGTKIVVDTQTREYLERATS